MNYASLRQQIANRLDQRSDLDQIIQDFVQDRITYWSAFFFYSSDVTDTSVTTSPGVYLYDLPNNIRNVRKIRLLIPGTNNSYTTLTSALTLPQATIAVGSTSGFTTTGTLSIGGNTVAYTGITSTTFTGCSGGSGLVTLGTGVSQVAPSTTTTADVTLPGTSISVVSTQGFLASGALSLGGSQVVYTSLNATAFLGCQGGTGTVLSGSLVQQIYGIWYPLIKIRYLDLLDMDPLAPPNQALSNSWAPFGTQFRLFPSPASQYQIEITGNAGPAAPSTDSASNFWTTDASALIINDTAAEIYGGYLHNPARESLYRGFGRREKSKLMKTSWDLNDGPRVIKGHL